MMLKRAVIGSIKRIIMAIFAVVAFIMPAKSADFVNVNVNDLENLVFDNSDGSVVYNYIFNAVEDVYTVNSTLSAVDGFLNIKGVADGENKSTIDLNGNRGFVVSNDNSVLHIADVEIKGGLSNMYQSASVIHIGNKSANVVLENVTMSNNETYAPQAIAHGVISNFGTLSVDGVFKNNFVENKVVENSSSRGGVIYNEGTITKISGLFEGNTVITHDPISNTGALGAAIDNDEFGVIGGITADFIGNSAVSDNMGLAEGGAIANRENAKIDKISGNFTGNFASSSYGADGGAIHNIYGHIGDISGEFKNNYVVAETHVAQGGAIANGGTISTINGDFNGNFAISSRISDTMIGAYGGAIYNANGATISSIEANFTNNYVSASDSGAFGGAIYNSGTIGAINGNFTNNYAKSINKGGFGGAILNYTDAVINSIEGDFVGNYALSSMENSGTKLAAGGAAICNRGTIGTIVGNFVGNYAKKTSDDIYAITQGGAISNTTGVIDSIKANFSENYVYGDSGFGGAILTKNIGNIEGDFTGNYVHSTAKNARGGAIGLAAAMAKDAEGNVIGGIKGNFSDNYAYLVGDGSAMGGAIYMNAAANTAFIEGNFTGNYATSSSSSAQGGAIYNNGEIGLINGGFIGNYVQSSSSAAYGGAIYNENVIIEIVGSFVENRLFSNSDDNKGGAIYNSGIITKLTADFNSNESGSRGKTYGGALYNGGIISNIVGNFTNNRANSWYNTGHGGAVYNSGEITLIAGDFIENYISGMCSGYNSVSSITGGAIANEGGTITTITGDFTGNYISGSASSGYNAINQVLGGALYNSGTITKIAGNFDKNYIESQKAKAYGGALYNSGTITSINGDFSNNSAQSLAGNENALGGAIYNSGTITSIVGNFVDNSGENGTYSNGGAIYNSGTIGSLTGDFIRNYVSTQSYNSRGGAIYNTGVIGSIAGDFVGNYVLHTGRADGRSRFIQGGAIYNGSNSIITSITGDFIDNYVSTSSRGDIGGGAIYNSGTIGSISGNFIGNYVSSSSSVRGGAIYNTGKIDKISSSFISNYAKSEIGTAQGGAIYTTADLKLVADNKALEIRDNYTMSKGVKDDNAIYVAKSNAKLTFDIKNNGSILLKDNIDGTAGYKFDVVGDNTGVFYLQNDIRNADVSMGGITLNTINNQVYDNHFNSFSLTDSINMAVDVDLASSTMDRISADTLGQLNGTINVVAMNLLSDAKSDLTTIEFAQGGLKDNVTTTVSEVAYTPIYKYNVSYDKSGENGMFVFSRFAQGGSSGSTGNSSDAFNPAVLGGSTSATVGAVGTMNQAVGYSFNSVDAYMNIPYMERMAMKRRNHYALAGVPDDVRQLGRYSPLYLPGDEEESIWVKPYSVFESVPLKNGPKVSNISYGTLVGFDSQMQSLRRGWDRVISGYVGYTGASQRYNGVDSVQNGGLLGGTVTMYKGNFFNATTLSVGANVAQNETMYGKDDYTMLMSGIANKAGYNFEFKDGKVILQPSMLVGYTFVNTFDYTNAAGVRIDNKPLHTIQVSPGVKVIGNLKNGWQPYASVNMVWNLMGKYDASANGVKLPEMQVKPYVLYGVGLQKRIKDHFMAYGQAMLHHGGRNGVSLTAGFRWALGHKEACGYEIPEIKREKDLKDVLSSKKLLKELSMEQKTQIEKERKMIFKIRKNVVSTVK